MSFLEFYLKYLKVLFIAILAIVIGLATVLILVSFAFALRDLRYEILIPSGLFILFVMLPLYGAIGTIWNEESIYYRDKK